MHIIIKNKNKLNISLPFHFKLLKQHEYKIDLNFKLKRLENF